MNTIQLLDAIRERHKLPSDYAAAALLNITRQQASKYRNGKEGMGDEVAQRAAALLGKDPAVIVAAMHAERAVDPQTRKLWVGIAKRLERAGVAAAVAACGITFTGGPDGGAMAADGSSGRAVPQFVAHGLYIMSTALRLTVEGFKRLCAVANRQARRLSTHLTPDIPALFA